MVCLLCIRKDNSVVVLRNVDSGGSVRLEEMCSACENQDQLNKKGSRYGGTYLYLYNYINYYIDDF